MLATLCLLSDGVVVPSVTAPRGTTLLRAGTPVALAWLNADELASHSPTVTDPDGSQRTIELGIRASGLVAFHDFDWRLAAAGGGGGASPSCIPGNRRRTLPTKRGSACLHLQTPTKEHTVACTYSARVHNRER